LAALAALGLGVGRALAALNLAAEGHDKALHIPLRLRLKLLRQAPGPQSAVRKRPINVFKHSVPSAAPGDFGRAHTLQRHPVEHGFKVLRQDHLRPPRPRRQQRQPVAALADHNPCAIERLRHRRRPFMHHSPPPREKPHRRRSARPPQVRFNRQPFGEK
jgi:hypothetical protein